MKMSSNIHTETAHYTYRVTWSEEDGEFVGLCAEFPSLSFLAATDVDAFQGIKTLVADVIADMLKAQESIPTPLAHHAFSGKLVLRMTPEKHRLLALEAAEQGVSLNQYINSRLH